MPLGTDATDAPAGPVEVVGRLRESATRRAGQLTDSDPNDALVPRVDIPAIAPRLDGDPAFDAVLRVLEASPPARERR